MNERKALGNVRVPDTVRAPNPTARIFGRRLSFVSVEPRKIHAPNVPLFGRKRAAIALGEPLHSTPWKGEFYGPAAILVLVVIHAAIEMHRCAHARKMPVKLAEPASSWMSLEIDSVEGF